MCPSSPPGPPAVPPAWARTAQGGAPEGSAGVTAAARRTPGTAHARQRVPQGSPRAPKGPEEARPRRGRAGPDRARRPRPGEAKPGGARRRRDGPGARRRALGAGGTDAGRRPGGDAPAEAPTSPAEGRDRIHPAEGRDGEAARPDNGRPPTGRGTNQRAPTKQRTDERAQAGRGAPGSAATGRARPARSPRGHLPGWAYNTPRPGAARRWLRRPEAEGRRGPEGSPFPPAIIDFRSGAEGPRGKGGPRGGGGERPARRHCRGGTVSLPHHVAAAAFVTVLSQNDQQGPDSLTVLYTLCRMAGERGCSLGKG